MSNPELLTAGTDPVQIDPIIDLDGTVYLKAAGDALGIPADASDPAAPQMFQLYARGTLTNRSGTITLGGTAQTLAAINLLRRYLFILNLHATEDLWINFTTAAAASQPSIRLPAGASFVMEGSYISTELVSVIAASTAHAFTAKEG